MPTAIGTYYSVQMTTDSHLNRTISTSCCIHTVVPPDDGPRYARNMQRLTKYTKNQLCIKLVFIYTRTHDSRENKFWPNVNLLHRQAGVVQCVLYRTLNVSFNILPIGVFFLKLFEDLKSMGNKTVTAPGVLRTVGIS